MIISQLELVNFRNIERERFEAGRGLNFFYGDNAQGKTSLVEALYLLANGRSFRTPRPGEAVGYGQSEAIVRATVQRQGSGFEIRDSGVGEETRQDRESRITDRTSRSRELALQLTPKSKSFFLNGKRLSLGSYLGTLAVFVCSLEQMDVVRGEPEQRRSFLDAGILTVDPKYAKALDDYNRVLKQKNRLLKIASEGEVVKQVIEQIEVWNQQLVEFGTLVHEARTRYVRQLGQAMPGNLFGVEQVTVRYVSPLEAHGDVSDYKNLFAERLGVRREAELAVGYSLIGPHRDDLEIKFNGQDLRHYGSLGQQRSALIILDLAQISVYNEALNDRGIFLVDDIDAELDRRRIDTLLDHLEGRAQSFITTSKRDIAEAYSERASLYFIQGGRIQSALNSRPEERDKSQSEGEA
jgi:DNA replication and repair protein RecF